MISYNKSGIKINPANRGKFIEYCDGNVTRECIEKGKKSNSAAVRARAIFAENARTWKHQTGGSIYFEAIKNFDEDSLKEFELNKIDLLSEYEPASLTENTTDTTLNEDKIELLPVSANDSTSTNRSLQFKNYKEFRDYIYSKLINKGVESDTAKVMAAQMGLESGHGNKTVGDYNYSNITKGNWNGKTATVKGNNLVFRSYDNIDQAVDDYLRLNSIYDITSNTSKEDIYDRWLGNNSRNLAWNGKNNQKYKNAIESVYKMYWN